MIFVLDNYDSFTYNLVQYIGEMGHEVVVRRNDQITVEEIEQLRPERIVISPGPCTPQEAGISIDVIKHFAGKRAALRCMSRTPGHRRGVRRQRGSRCQPDARQDQSSRA